jgi:hypothetical protein
MGVKCRSNFGLHLILRMLVGLELRIATFADADGWQRRPYDAELAGVHGWSLAHPTRHPRPKNGWDAGLLLTAVGAYATGTQK